MTATTAYEKEINRIMTAVELGAMSAEEGKANIAAIKAKYGIGGATQPPTNNATATAATAIPRRTTKEALEAMKKGEEKPQPKSKCKWVKMPLPEPLDQDGERITEGLSVITVRAIEGPKRKFKKGEKWEGSGLPNGKIGIGTGFRNELTMTVAQFLQMYAKMEEIHDAIMGTTDKDGNEVPGIVDDSQPREILVL